MNISTESLACYHCGLPVINPQEFTLNINGQLRDFCCPGCQAVAGVIHDGGLDQFYQYRSTLNRRPNTSVNDFSIYDRDELQESFVDFHEETDSTEKTAHLLLDDITCAACVWLIEKHLQSVDGIINARVNASSHQCLVRWDTQKTSLSRIMTELAVIGYMPQPLSDDSQQAQRQKQQRLLLMRLGLAAFGMMQVGMVAIALYAGALQGIDHQWLNFLRWVSLLIATPIVLFSAQPFWSAAWRSLKRRYLTMEVPVSLAIILAYVASAWATIKGSFYVNTEDILDHSALGEVYFDSIAMFTFFLLLGRYLEMRTRYRNHQQTANYTRLLPITVIRVDANDDTSSELIPLSQLNVDDWVRINTGDTIPCDGEVIEGQSTVVEALLTGEAAPVHKQKNDNVIAGTVNTEGSLLIRATAVHQQTRLSTIEKLTHYAQQNKPRIQVIADKVASYFVAMVLLVAGSVYLFWHFHQPESALWITLSVLVVTCPCALSLATPTVLTATVAKMRTHGLLILKSHVIETLVEINKVIFDKTGTLTYGEPKVVDVVLLGSSAHNTLSKQKVLDISAALEQGSSHPIANAFSAYQGSCRATDVQIVTGAGVRGVVNGKRYSLGKLNFSDGHKEDIIKPPSEGQWLALREQFGDQTQSIVAWIQLSDQLRESASQALHELDEKNVTAEILSGDSESVVKGLAQELGSLSYLADVSPEKKLHYVSQQQSQNDKILMAGDGINDVPVLAGADVSVAMGGASDFTRTNADMVLLNSDLRMLPRAISIAHRCKRIIRQNIAWSLLYNITALPLAAAGLIPPYLAAIGMSLSSLIVVCNALRIMRD